VLQQSQCLASYCPPCRKVSCRHLQCVAACCDVLQQPQNGRIIKFLCVVERVSASCSVLQCEAVRCSSYNAGHPAAPCVLGWVAASCSLLQALKSAATSTSSGILLSPVLQKEMQWVLQCVAVCCIVVQQRQHVHTYFVKIGQLCMYVVYI